MIQRIQVLTREDNRISFTATAGTTTQDDYLTIAERAMPVNAIEQTWIFEVGEMTRASRTSPKLVSTLVKIAEWLNHLGSGKINDSCLEARHNIHHNFRINGIGR